MKKKNAFVLLLSFFILLSCEVEDYVSPNSYNVSNSLTRSATIDPLAQLEGIPLYIKPQNFGDYNYFSSGAPRNGRHPFYVSETDPFKWTLQKSSTNSNAYYIMVMENIPNVVGLYLSRGSRTGGIQLSTTPCDFLMDYHERKKSYYIYYQVNDDPSSRRSYLQPHRMDDPLIVWVGEDRNDNDKVHWAFVPAEEFKIIDITYDLTADDNFSVVPILIAQTSRENYTDVPRTETVTLSSNVSLKSSFSETQGITVAIQMSAGVKIPSFIEGSFNAGITSTESWSYSTTSEEVRTTTLTETTSFELPPRTTIIVKLIATEYKANLTYTAELKGLTTGKTIFLQGKWNGTIVQESIIQTLYP